MALSDELRDKTLARLRERCRGQYPTERLILVLDSRSVPEKASRTSVVAIEASSPWYELLPPEQIVEIFDQEPEQARIGQALDARDRERS